MVRILYLSIFYTQTPVYFKTDQLKYVFTSVSYSRTRRASVIIGVPYDIEKREV